MDDMDGQDGAWPAERAQGDGGAVPEATLEVMERAYQAFIQPRRFVELMDTWGGHIARLDPADASRLNLRLEGHMEQALPLLESSLDRTLAQDDLIHLIHQEARPALALSTNGIVMAANEAAEMRLGLVEGDMLCEEAFEREDWLAVTEFMRLARIGGLDRRHCVVKHYASDGSRMLVDISGHQVEDRPEATLVMKGFELSLTPQAFEILQHAFGLTEAEIAIIGLMLDGGGAPEIAAARRTSVATVRTQIRTIREKTGARSQIDLVRMVAGLSALEEVDRADRATVGARLRRAYRMPRHHDLVRLPSGAEIEYVRVGEPGGRPLLVLHGSLFGFRWPAALVDPLLAEGFTLWFPVRPGYGRSTAVEEERGFEEEVAILGEFADEMGLDAFGVVGQGVASLIAIAVAARMSNRVRGVVNLSSYLPIGTTELLRDMAPWQRTVLHMARVSPRLMRFVSSAGLRMMRQIGPREFYQRTYATSPADMAVADDPEKLALLRISFNLVQAQNLKAFSQDFTRVTSDWREAWDAVRAPILLVHGGQPQVFAPDVTRRFCEGRANVELEMLPNGGQMLAYSHPVACAELTLRHFRGRLN